MRKTLIAVAAAATLALGSLAVPQPAQARDGGAVAAGIIGGIAAGAILGSMAAHPRYYYDDDAPPYYYAPGPVYYHRRHCWWGHRRYWDGWDWHWRRVWVCR